MIEKRIESSSEDTFWDLWSVDDGIVKTASATGGTIPKVAEEVVSKKEFDPRFRYILVSAVGSGEHWGPNRRGDYFPEGDLLGLQGQNELRSGESPIARFLTFLKAKYYRRHKNKTHDPHYGHVEDVIYDPDMHKVILLIAVDKEKAPDIVRRIDDDELTSVSMGCNVKFDVCSICGNKAKTLKDYCPHLKHEMNRVYPDGRKVFAINTTPRFFDISDVITPAWEGGFQLAKVGSLDALPEGDKYEWENDPYKTHGVGPTKMATRQTFFNEVEATAPHISKAALDKLAEIPLPSALGAFKTAQIAPKPSEFAYLVFRACGMEKEAEQVYGKDLDVDEGVVGDASIEFSQGLDAAHAAVNILSSCQETRSEDALLNRSMRILAKQAELPPVNREPMSRFTGKELVAIYGNFLKEAGNPAPHLLAMAGAALIPQVVGRFNRGGHIDRNKNTYSTLAAAGTWVGYRRGVKSLKKLLSKEKIK